MKIIQILQTENNYTWQGAILGLGDDGVLYELAIDKNAWIKLTDPVVYKAASADTVGNAELKGGGTNEI